MEFLHLRVLREVARRRTISGAAEALGYTQPAVSRQLALLERRVGTPLVERTSRGAQLTTAGDALLVHAEAILDRVDLAQLELESVASLASGRVRVAAFPTAAATFVPGAVRAFRDAHPGVSVEFHLGEPERTHPMLRERAVELVVTMARPDGPLEPGLVATPLLEDPIFCALPPGHRLAGADVIELEDVAGDDWILGTGTLCPDRELLLCACEALGFLPTVAFQCDDYAAGQGLVAAGLGVAPIPALALRARRDDVVVRPFAQPLLRRVIALERADAAPEPAREALLAALGRAAAAERHTPLPV